MGSSNYISFYVNGIPAPQGSKKHVGKGIMVEVSKKLKPWRNAVSAAAVVANKNHVKFDGPLRIDVTFYMPRPQSRKKDKYHSVMPDIDKLLRSTFDALTKSELITDDARFSSVHAEKKYVLDDPSSNCSRPGAFITVGTILK